MSSQDYSITGFLHIGYTVCNMEASVLFWTKILGIEHCQQQFIDHKYIGEITGVTNCACKLSFIRAEEDPHMIELLEYVRPHDKTLVFDPGESAHMHLGYYAGNADNFYNLLMSHSVKCFCEPRTIDYGPYKGCKGFGISDPMGAYMQIIDMAQSKSNDLRITRLANASFSVKSLNESLPVFKNFLGFDVEILDTSASEYLNRICRKVPKRVAICSSKTMQVTVEIWETGEAGRIAEIHPSTRGCVHLCFTVKNIEELYCDFAQKGIQFAVDKPGEVLEGINKGAKAIYFKVPGGIWIELFEGKSTQI